MRIGTGFDVHRLVPGRKLILGGTEIPFDKGLQKRHLMHYLFERLQFLESLKKLV